MWCEQKLSFCWIVHSHGPIYALLKSLNCAQHQAFYRMIFYIGISLMMRQIACTFDASCSKVIDICNINKVWWRFGSDITHFSRYSTISQPYNCLLKEREPKISKFWIRGLLTPTKLRSIGNFKYNQSHISCQGQLSVLTSFHK